MSDFWTRKLGGPQYGRGGGRESSTYSRSPRQAPAPAQPAPEQQDYAPAQAQSTRQHLGPCPNCGSGDYIKAGENIKARCYTCGFPLLQSTSGLTATERNPEKVRPARQLPWSRKSGFNPKSIIGRVE